MISSARIAVIVGSFALLIAITIFKTTTARELRPADHGLESLDYQSPPPLSKTATTTSSSSQEMEMESFFKGSISPSTLGNVALPRAMNSTDSSWWWSGGGGGGGEGRDRVRHAMLVASLVCGAAGVTLFVASGFIYFFSYRSRKSSSSLVDNNAK